MGRGAAPARTSSSSWTAPGLFLLIATFLLCESRIEAHVCPSYCVCSVAMDSFHHVVCERASLDSIPRQVPSKPNTTFLNMAWNHITIIRERDLDDFKELQGLVMDHNKLNNIDKEKPAPPIPGSELQQDNPPFRSSRSSKSRSLVFLNLTATDLSVLPRKSAFAEHAQHRAPGAEQQTSGATDAHWGGLGAGQGAGRGAPPHATCDQPAALHGRPWRSCGGWSGGGAGVGAAAHASRACTPSRGLLVVIAGRWVAGGGVGLAAALAAPGRAPRLRGRRRKHRLAPPVGEYIDGLGDPPPAKSPSTTALRDPPPKDVAKEQRRTPTRSATSPTSRATRTWRRSSSANDGPIYVNMKGPRGLSCAAVATAPRAPARRPAPRRRQTGAEPPLLHPAARGVRFLRSGGLSAGRGSGVETRLRVKHVAKASDEDSALKILLLIGL
ncbi:Protein of unknown function [Gryllus bimaculatus]|nr:Protein of unknown function [Gryllus bimaculatus]